MNGQETAILGLFVTTIGQFVALMVLIWKGGRWTASVEMKLAMLDAKVSDRTMLEDHESRLRAVEQHVAKKGS